MTDKAEKLQVPPAWHMIGQHAMLPEANHDQVARFNFLAAMNRHLATAVSPGNRIAYEQRVKPAMEKSMGGPPKHRSDIRRAMKADPYYQMWSALRRNTMEMRQQAGRSLVLGQIEALAEKAAEWIDDDPKLEINPNHQVPKYLAAADNHCMPGSYYTALIEGDVSAAANYDSGMFVTTGGALGRFNDGGGQALAEWMLKHHPEFQPKRILAIGCGCGHSLLPLAKAYPHAEITGVDSAAPMLRYGMARAKAMGIENVRFVQRNGEDTGFPDGHFDWIQTTMFLHETSYAAIHQIMAEIHRMLAPGGITLHIEQPQYTDDMDLYEQFIRDWDSYYNNEPFWSKMHDIHAPTLMKRAGFRDDEFLESQVRAVLDPELFPYAAQAQADEEDHGRAASWYVFGARKKER